MDDERTLLQQIRDKELELEHELDLLRKDAEGRIAAARAEADLLLKQAEEEGGRLADSHILEARKAADAGIREMERETDSLMETLRAQGERNIPAAAEKIVTLVTFRDR